MTEPNEEYNKSTQLDANQTELMEMCSQENKSKISPDGVVNGSITHVPSPVDVDIDGIIEIPLSQNKVKISLENSVTGTTSHIPSPKVLSSYGNSPKCSPPVDLEFNGILETPPSQNTNKISLENTVNITTTHIPSTKLFSSNEESPKCSPPVDVDIDGIVKIPPIQNKIKIFAEDTVNGTTTHTPLPEFFSINENSPKCSPPVDLDGNLDIKISSENNVNGTTAHKPSSKYISLNADSPKHSQRLEEDFTTLSPLEKNIKMTPEDTVNGFSTHVPSPGLFSMNGDKSSPSLDEDFTELEEYASPERKMKMTPNEIVNGVTTPVLFSINGDLAKSSPSLDRDFTELEEYVTPEKKMKMTPDEIVNGATTPDHFTINGDLAKSSPSLDRDFTELEEYVTPEKKMKITPDEIVNGATTPDLFTINGDLAKSPSLDRDFTELEEYVTPEKKMKMTPDEIVNSATTPDVFSINGDLAKSSPSLDRDFTELEEYASPEKKMKMTPDEIVNSATTPDVFSMNGDLANSSPSLDRDFTELEEYASPEKKMEMTPDEIVNGATTPDVFSINGDLAKSSPSLDRDFTELEEYASPEKNMKMTPDEIVNGAVTLDLFSVNGDLAKSSPSLDGDFTKLEEYASPEKNMQVTPDEIVNGAAIHVASPDLFSVNGDTLKCSQPLDVVNRSSTHISSSNLGLEYGNTTKIETALIDMSDCIVFGKKDNSTIVTNTINEDELEANDSDNEDKSTGQYCINKKMPYRKLIAEQYNKIRNSDFENLSQSTDDKNPQENAENNHTDSDIDVCSQERISQIVFDSSNWQEYDTIVHEGKIVSKSLLLNGEIQLDDTQTEEFKEYTLDELDHVEVNSESMHGERNITPINGEMQKVIDETKMKNISEHTLAELSDDEVKSDILQNGTDSFQVNGEGHYFQTNGDIEETRVKIFDEYTLDDLNDVEVKTEIIQKGIKSLHIYEDENRTEFDPTQVIKLNGSLLEDDDEEIEVIVIDPDKSASEESQSQIYGEEKDSVFDQINAYNETEDVISEEDKSSQNMNMTLKYEDGILPLLTEVDQSVLDEADILMFQEYFAQLNAGEIQTVIDDPQVIDSYNNHFLEHLQEDQKDNEGKTIRSEDIVSQESQEEKQTVFDEVKTVDNIIDGINLEDDITYLNDADVLTLEEYMLQASAEEAQMFLDETQMIMCQEVTLPPNDEEEEQIVVDNSQISEFRDINLQKIKRIPKRKSKTKKTKPRIRITPLRKVVKSFMRKKTRKQRPDPDYSTWYMANDNPHKKLAESKSGRRRKQKNPRFINDLPAVLRRLNLDPVPRPPKLSPNIPLETFTQVVKPVHPYKIRRKPRKPKIIKQDQPEQIVEEGENSGIYSKKSLFHNSEEIVIVDEYSTEAHNQSIISISSSDEEPVHIEVEEDIPPTVSNADEDLNLMKVTEEEEEKAEDERQLEKDLITDKDEKSLEEVLITDEDEKPLEKEFITDEEFVEYAVSVIDFLYEQQYVNEE